MHIRIANIKPCDISRSKIKLWEIQKAIEETKNNLTYTVADHTSDGMTFRQDPLSQNSAGWKAAKQKAGFSTEPMQMKDFDFVNRSFMFLLTYQSTTRALLSLNPRAMKKYWEVKNIALRKGKNYHEILPDKSRDEEMQFFVQSLYEELNAVLKPRGLRLQLR